MTVSEKREEMNTQDRVAYVAISTFVWGKLGLETVQKYFSNLIVVPIPEPCESEKISKWPARYWISTSTNTLSRSGMDCTCDHRTSRRLLKAQSTSTPKIIEFRIGSLFARIEYNFQEQAHAKGLEFRGAPCGVVRSDAVAVTSDLNVAG